MSQTKPHADTDMTQQTLRATLSDEQARGGVIGGTGYAFQAAYIVSRIPNWLSDPDFAAFLQEGAGDVDVRFNRAEREERWYIQVKNYQVTPALARDVFAEFQKTDRGSPGTYTCYILACPGLNGDLRRLRSAVEELRGARSFFRPERDKILHNTWVDLETLATKLELPVNAQFLVDKVRFDTDLAGLTDGASLRRLFVGSLLELDPWAGATRAGLLRAYEKIALLSHQELRVTYSREEVEAKIREAIDSPMLPAATAPVIGNPFNLPGAVTDFVGREDEIAAVRDGLASGTAPVSIISGMGGAGKTALALRVAHALADEGRFADAQLYIDLKGTDPQPLPAAAALGALLTAVAGPDPQRPDGEDELAGLWRAVMRGKDAVLVLDNAANAAQVRPLLPGSPSCAVLVTSRQRFTLPGATLLSVEAMHAGEARDMLQCITPRLDDAGADLVATLCGRLPLALRVAGSLLKVNNNWTVARYAARLADEKNRLSRLRDPDDPTLDVEANIRLSVDQLDGGARQAWALLSLFPAPFDAAAAAAVWSTTPGTGQWQPLDEDETQDRLDALRNRSLLSYDGKADRYALHDLLRLAAGRKLESDVGASEAAAASERLAWHFLAVAQKVNETQDFTALDADWPHLQAALDYADARAGEDSGLLSDLVFAANGYLSTRGLSREWAKWCLRAADASAAAGRRVEEGSHLGNLGNAYHALGDARQAIGYYEQALVIARDIGDRGNEGRSLGSLGRAYHALGDARQAIGYYEQALTIARDTGNRQGEGSWLGSLGAAYLALGDAQQAIGYFEQALAIARDIGDRRNEGAHLGSLGITYAALGDARQAIGYYEQALVIARDIGDRRNEGICLLGLGASHAAMGDQARARDLWAESLSILETIEDSRADQVRKWLADLGEN